MGVPCQHAMSRLDTSTSIQVSTCVDRPGLLETASSSRLLFLLRNKNLKVRLDFLASSRTTPPSEADPCCLVIESSRRSLKHHQGLC